MSKVVLCIYHGNCADGLGAAWATRRALGDSVEFIAAKYGEDPPTGIADRNVLIVDFSYPLAVLRAMAREARSILVIDHHKTAQEDLQTLETNCQSCQDWQLTVNEWINPDVLKLAAIFDMERSGAGLTWDYLHPEQRDQKTGFINKTIRPHIIDLIEDRDLWRFAHGDETRAFHAVLTSYDIADLPAAFARMDEWNHWAEHQNLERCKNNWYFILGEGRAILRAKRQEVATAVATTRRTIRIAGHVVPCANVPPSMASDAGHLLIELAAKEEEAIFGCPAFSATYYDGADGKRHFSLRSPGGGADVGKIAKEMAAHFNFLTAENFKDFKYEWRGTWAGGGHEHAAGFDAPLGWEGDP